MSTTHRDKGRAPDRSGGAASSLGAAGAAASGAGAAAVATAATACCAGPIVAPVVVGVLGAGGAAWAAGLKPYAPWLLAASLLFLGYGFWVTYRRPTSCGPPGKDRRHWLRRASIVVLWLAAALWLVAASVNVVLAIAS